MCLSDSANFRKDLTPTYKSKRKETRKPIVFRPLLEWVKETYDPVIKPRLEADDVLGILATHPDRVGKCVIVSDDKDMQTLPCTLYRQGVLKVISEDEADYFWAFQTLTGDSTDGYQGCPGVGPKKAESILTAKPYWPKIVNTYRKAGLTEDDALLNARLARILRFSDWDVTNQQVKLWTPTTTTQAAA
jgi:DNA polymerase-1